MILIRKLPDGRWLLFPHPQTQKTRLYESGQAALDEIARLYALWPRCASYDDFLDNQPDEAMA